LQEAAVWDDSFQKKTYENGALKKIEDYDDDRKLWLTQYFLAEDENAPNVLLDLQKSCEHICLLHNKVVQGLHTQWDREEYFNNTLSAIGKDVFNANMKIIAYQELDLQTHLVKRTEKYCYLRNLAVYAVDHDMVDYGSLEFLYKPQADGTEEVEVIVNLLGFEGEIFLITPTENIFNHSRLAHLFDWARQPYYHDSSPLLP
jgi:hypothetical protein